MSQTAEVRAAHGKIAALAASVARQTLASAIRKGSTSVEVTLPTQERLSLGLKEFAEFIGDFVSEARADDEIVAKQDAVLAEIQALVISS